MKSIFMVHGLSDTGKVFSTMSQYFNQHGYQTHTIDLIPNFGTGDLRDLAQQVQAYIKEQLPASEKIILIGFSMGGLVTRYYLQRLNGLTKVSKYISISAPNNGSRLGYLLPLQGIKQMRPSSDFLQDLNRDRKKQLGQLDCLTLWTPVDTMIIPANSSLMGIGKEISIPWQIHKWMLKDDRVLNYIHQFVKN